MAESVLPGWLPPGDFIAGAGVKFADRGVHFRRELAFEGTVVGRQGGHAGLEAEFGGPSMIAGPGKHFGGNLEKYSRYN